MKYLTGVLLVNTGTPSALDIKSIRKYLKEFLLDHRIIKMPRIFWIPILYLFILPFRPRKKVQDYSKIWMKEGSPLLVYTNRLLKKLINSKSKINNMFIDIAMRYGEPNIKNQLTIFHEKKIKNIIILPLFPQFSFSTTESIRDKVTASLKELQWEPNIKFIKEYYKESVYIDSIAEIIRDNWQKKGKDQKLVFSYHGLPKKYISKGDTYYHSCIETSVLIAKKLNLKKEYFITSFHSKFGFGQWTEPYTEKLLLELPKVGIKSISIISPSFTIDCLETLEEIAIKFKEDFINAGGKNFNYIPCLNENKNHVLILEKLLKV